MNNNKKINSKEKWNSSLGPSSATFISFVQVRNFKKESFAMSNIVYIHI